MYNVTNVFDMIIRYFSNPVWLCLFIVSCVYLFFRANKKQKWAMLAAIVAFFLLINDAVRFLMEEVAEEKAVFYRHLWMIPTVTVTGIAFIDAFRRIRYRTLKVLLVLVGLAMIGLGYSVSPARHWETLTVNINQTPADVKEIGDQISELQEKSEKMLCVASTKSMYNWHLLYNGESKFFSSEIFARKGESGDQVLSSKEPDVQYVMSTACKKGIDYVIIRTSVGSQKAYEAAGYTALFETKGYALYACEGYEGIKKDYNKWGKISEKAFHDAEGNLTDTANGYAKVQYQYNDKGLKSEEHYFNAENEPCTLSGGYASILYEYDSDRRCVRESYLGTQGEPVIIEKGYATRLRVYIKTNKENKVSRITYLGTDGKPMMIPEGYSALTREYDEKGNVIAESYLDEEGEPVKVKGAYTEIRKEYDDKNQQIRQSYYAFGEKYTMEKGYHAYTNAYDESGNKINTRYYDAEDNPVKRIDGYAEVRRIYDDQNRLVRESYYDEEGRPVEMNKGYAFYEILYDGSGNVIEKRYYTQEYGLVQVK